MISKLLSRVAFSVLLCVLLVPPAFAGQPRRSASPANSFLSEVWQAVTALFPAFARSGAGMDPWGGGSTASTVDSGAGMDPWGDHVTSTGLSGTGMDPQE
jgi:hypothetical protein